MAVNQIRCFGLLTNVIENIISQAVEVIPQLFFGKVCGFATIKSHNLCTIRQRLNSLRIDFIQAIILQTFGDQINSVNIWVLAQCIRQFNHILGLSTCIRISPQFKIFSTNQAMHTDQQNIEPVIFFRHMPCNQPVLCGGNKTLYLQASAGILPCTDLHC